MHSQTEHLQASADAQHTATRVRSSTNRAIEACGSQPLQVTRNMLRPWKDHEVGTVHVLRGPRPAHDRDLFERLELIEVGSKGVADDRDNGTSAEALKWLRSPVLVRQRVL